VSGSAWRDYDTARLPHGALMTYAISALQTACLVHACRDPAWPEKDET
jgi:hypothetical protein